MSNEAIGNMLKIGDYDGIIDLMTPYANLIGRYDKDTKSEALKGLVIGVYKLDNLEHGEYLKYLCQTMKRYVRDYFSKINIVRIPRWYYRFHNDKGFDCSFQFVEVEDYHCKYTDNTYEVLDLILQQCRDEIDYKIINLRIKGLTDTEIAKEINLTQQAVSLRRNRIYEAYNKELKNER